MSKLWFCGDPHGNLRHILWQLERTPMADRPKAIILLGDIEAQQPLEKEIKPFLAAGIEVFWIRGNHDVDTEHSWRNLQGVMDRNIDGRIVEVAGVRIAGLGGVFRGEIWMPRATGNAAATEPNFANFAAYRQSVLSKQPARLRDTLDDIKNGNLRKHSSSIFSDTYERLAQLHADILVTHEPPAPHPYGTQALADLAAAMGVTRHFHGHTHDNLPYPEMTGSRTIGVGLRGITDENGNVIRAGEEDALSLRTFERNGGGWK